jgi:hypothetical protein
VGIGTAGVSSYFYTGISGNGVSEPIGLSIPYPSLDLNFQSMTTLDSRITFTRASGATYFDSSGVLQTVGNNVARLTYNPTTLAPLGLLIEEQRTNSIRNNTMQGAVAGTPGTLPTNWQKAESSSMAVNIVGVGTENGIQYVDVQYVGTASATTSSSIQFEQNSAIAASNGQTWSISSFVKIQSGTTTGISQIRIGWEERSGSFLAVQQAVINPTAGVNLSSSRFAFTATNGNASTTFIKPYILFTPINNAAINITLRIGLPQLEQGAFATSVIPTTTAAATRNADVASMTGTNFSSWYRADEGTLYSEWVKNGVLSFQSMAQISDGTTNNVIALAHGSGSPNNVRFDINVNSTNQASLTIVTGSVVGTLYKTIGAYKVNDFAAVANAGTVQTDTSGTIPNTSQFCIGINGALNGGWLNGTIRKIAYYPTRLSNAQLQALTR